MSIIAFNFLDNLIKYPRTPHLESSRLQDGDEGYDQIPFEHLKGKFIVVEEKLDGGNCGISFSPAGDLLLQSRGHFLTGGGRERQFNLFKSWAQAHEHLFIDVLEDRFIMYGEWMHKKHSIYYNYLPHFFLEFDIWDKTLNKFLSTSERKKLLKGLPVLSVPVLYEGECPSSLKDLKKMVEPSLAKTAGWKETYLKEAFKAGLTQEDALRMLDKSEKSEGLYLKVESDLYTEERFKWVRHDFVQTILDSNKHHAEQPYVANLLRPGVDIFNPAQELKW